MAIYRRIAILGVFLAAVGCGGTTEEPTTGGTAGQAETQEEQQQETAQAAAKPWDPSAGTAAIKGVVKFVGDPPRRRPIDMAGKAECHEIHTEPVLDESVVVNEDGTLKYAFVWVKRGLSNWRFPTPETPITLDQKGCMFHPHVQGVQAGQPITITNSDTFAHNVHALPKLNSPFNFTQAQDASDERKFDRREQMIYIKCDIHGWMSSYLGVVSHPYFATTGDDGTFTLENLPPGEYTVEAWHEVFGTQEQKLTLADNESKEIEFSFEDK